MDNRERSDASVASATEGRSIDNDARPTNSASAYVARRLTPRECARLQGFPPDWCDDVPHSDSAEYKLWGNGISLPVLLHMFREMKIILESEECFTEMEEKND